MIKKLSPSTIGALSQCCSKEAKHRFPRLRIDQERIGMELKDSFSASLTYRCGLGESFLIAAAQQIPFAEKRQLTVQWAVGEADELSHLFADLIGYFESKPAIKLLVFIPLTEGDVELAVAAGFEQRGSAYILEK